jgi:TolB-like protein
MRFPSKLFALFLLAAAIFAPHPAPAQDTGGRVVLVLPFDNLSGDASLNWIGDSFPDTLNKRLNSAGFLTISRDDRDFARHHHPHRPAARRQLRHHRQLHHPGRHGPQWKPEASR